jgi:hypothetical protein
VLKNKAVIPSQSDADLDDPEEHFLWALRNMPTTAGTGMVTSAAILRKWSEHLWKVGCVHRDYLIGKADENGFIHVSSLPHQQIKFQEAFRGPHHQYNNAARWVEENEPDPEPVRVPNIHDMTTQEKHALLYQLQREGLISPAAHAMSGAEVEKV